MDSARAGDRGWTARQGNDGGGGFFLELFFNVLHAINQALC